MPTLCFLNCHLYVSLHVSLDPVTAGLTGMVGVTVHSKKVRSEGRFAETLRMELVPFNIPRVPRCAPCSPPHPSPRTMVENYGTCAVRCGGSCAAWDTRTPCAWTLVPFQHPRAPDSLTHPYGESISRIM